MTLDGKIATRTGNSQWISNDASRTLTHILRGQVDAILVGIGTVLHDDSHLTARPPGPRVATRIVLDSHARLPLGSKLVRTAREVPTLVVASADTPETAFAPLRAEGCEVITLPDLPGHLDLSVLLEELGRRRMTNLLVEGGSGVLGSFLDAGLADEVHLFLAPKLVGGKDALTPVGGLGVANIADALRLTHVRVEAVEGDVYIHGRVAPRTAEAAEEAT
jgi:diaminohydroxyphosphoribosylaminopyrimidine deaminase/5-amino-6-(5-phosphoribosylamino)uracil reductase